MLIQEGVLDRIELSFIVMKNNFLHLILPLFIFNYIFFWFLYLFFMNFIMWLLWNINTADFTSIISVLYSAQWVLIISILMFMFLLYTILYIPILLATIRIIHKSFLNEKINLKEDILFGFKNISNSFRTYWFIFKYVYLIPAILFIIWGVWFNIWYLFDFEWNIWTILNSISIFIMIFSMILFIVFSIYRWLRASFSLYSATSQESFTQDNFDLNLKITKNNLLRILWNLILIWFIVWFGTSFIEGIFNIFLSDAVSIVWLEQIITSINSNSWSIDLNSILNNWDLSVSISNSSYLIWTFISQLIASIWSIFVFVFMYIFMKRLEIELQDSMNLELINEEKSKENNMNTIMKNTEL